MNPITVAVIDGRIQTTGFNAEQALTKDTVPVNVDAIIFWHVHDAEKAALAITNYREAIDRVAQTSLREMIGSSMLASLLSDRKDADEQLNHPRLKARGFKGGRFEIDYRQQFAHLLAHRCIP